MKGLKRGRARCFLKYARSFPESKYVAKAYWNAAINYEKERKIEKSIRALMLIVNNAADTEEEPKALFLIARNLTNIATYGAASKAYEYYAQKFPGEEKALVALQNAAFYRMGLGEYDKAIENYRKYMKLVGKKDKAKAAEVSTQLVRFTSSASTRPRRRANSKLCIKGHQTLQRVPQELC